MLTSYVLSSDLQDPRCGTARNRPSFDWNRVWPGPNLEKKSVTGSARFQFKKKDGTGFGQFLN